MSSSDDRTADQRARQGSDQGLEERQVQVADENFSPETNRRVTEDVREVIGRDSVKVPADRPRPSRGEHPQSTSVVSVVAEHRFFLGHGVAASVVVLAILALLLRSWWILAGVVVVLLVALVAVVVLTINLASADDRPSPTTAAALEEEGVPDPEAYFSDVVHEFSEPEDARGTQQRS